MGSARGNSRILAVHNGKSCDGFPMSNDSTSSISINDSNQQSGKERDAAQETSFDSETYRQGCAKELQERCGAHERRLGEVRGFESLVTWYVYEAFANWAG